MTLAHARARDHGGLLPAGFIPGAGVSLRGAQVASSPPRRRSTHRSRRQRYHFLLRRRLLRLCASVIIVSPRRLSCGWSAQDDNLSARCDGRRRRCGRAPLRLPRPFTFPCPRQVHLPRTIAPGEHATLTEEKRIQSFDPVGSSLKKRVPQPPGSSGRRKRPHHSIVSRRDVSNLERWPEELATALDRSEP